MSASLDERLRGVEWGKYRLGDIFTFKSIKQAKSQREIPTDRNGIHYIVQSMGNNMYDRNVNKQWLVDNNEAPVDGNAIVLGVTLPAVSYQPVEFGASQVITARADFLNEPIGLFFVIILKKLCFYLFSYDKKPGISIYKNLVVELPTKGGKIDFDFMESFIAQLEALHIAELEAYLSVTGLKDYILTEEEEKALKDFESWNWDSFNLEALFGKSTRGKRLKSADRIDGELPFVTAGEALEGISAYIGNNVDVFEANTTTIDMFGSAKYRNYKYGADDHVAVVHTESLPKFASIFTTTAIHKSAHTGKFSYSRNFYAKDADELYITLPVLDGKPDYDRMGVLISAIQKLVIKDVVKYSEEKISATKLVTDN